MASELVKRLNWWAAKRKPPKGMKTLPADCREAADRIEALERENATLRAGRDEARKAAIEEAAAICDGQAKYFRDLSNNPACLTDIRWNSQSEAKHTMQSYAERHETDAAAIRNMGGGE